MENELNQFLMNLNKCENVLKKYLPEKTPDDQQHWLNSMKGICLKIYENNKNNQLPFYDFSDNENTSIIRFNKDVYDCLGKVYKRIRRKIFYGNSDQDLENSLESYIEDEKTIYDFILQLNRLSKYRIIYINLHNVSDVISDVIVFSDHADSFKFDEDGLRKFFKSKTDFFNNLNELDQDILSLRHFYIKNIGYSFSILLLSGSDVKNVFINSIIDILLELLKNTQNHKIDNSKLSTHEELIGILKNLRDLNGRNKDICFELLKNISLDEDSDISQINIFQKEILNGNVQFFDEMFELFPEMNNFRLKLSTFSIASESLDVFDYFLNEKYVSEIHQIQQMIVDKKDNFNECFPWVNSRIRENINEHENLLFIIHRSEQKDLFMRKILMKDKSLFNPLPIKKIIDRLELGNFNFNHYLDFVTPLLTKELLEKSISEVKKINQVTYNIEILQDLLVKKLNSFNKVKKIKSIKLKT